MKSPQLERIVGLFLLGGMLSIGYFALKMGSVHLVPAETYVLEARFTNAAGLIDGSQVAIAGVPIGTVTGMKLAKDFSALVQMRLQKAYSLPSDSTASIRGHGLLGDKYISIAPGGADDFLSNGSRITDTESAVDLESLLSRFAFGSVQSDKKTPQKE
jgi:phospholipid/cholesterol/gamma-HCH transport system substrate-binding protein